VIQPVSLKSDAAELLMAEMLELRRMQIGSMSAQNAREPAQFNSAETPATSDNAPVQSILAVEKPLFAPLFETKMPPRPLLELAKEGYEALQALSQKRAEAA